MKSSRCELAKAHQLLSSAGCTLARRDQGFESAFLQRCVRRANCCIGPPASHNAAMECHRRAMIDGQTLESRRDNLNQASKLSRNFVTLMDAYDRRRGKVQQRIIVERVDVHSGGQAIVDNITPNDGSSRRSKE